MTPTAYTPSDPRGFRTSKPTCRLVLWALRDAGGHVTRPALCEATGLSREGVARAVRQLVADGQVEVIERVLIGLSDVTKPPAGVFKPPADVTKPPAGVFKPPSVELQASDVTKTPVDVTKPPAGGLKTLARDVLPRAPDSPPDNYPSRPLKGTPVPRDRSSSSEPPKLTPGQAALASTADAVLGDVEAWHAEWHGKAATKSQSRGWRRALTLRLADDGLSVDAIAERAEGIRRLLAWWSLPVTGRGGGGCWMESRVITKTLGRASALTSAIEHADSATAAQRHLAVPDWKAAGKAIVEHDEAPDSPQTVESPQGESWSPLGFAESLRATMQSSGAIVDDRPWRRVLSGVKESVTALNFSAVFEALGYVATTDSEVHVAAPDGYVAFRARSDYGDRLSGALSKALKRDVRLVVHEEG